MNNAFLLAGMGTGGKVVFERLSSTEMGKEGGCVLQSVTESLHWLSVTESLH